MKNQLLVPEAVKTDRESMEILRVWIAHKDQHFTLRIGLWKDPAAWGLLLADLARNISNSYAEDTAVDREAALTRIKLAFNTELDNNTDV